MTDETPPQDFTGASEAPAGAPAGTTGPQDAQGAPQSATEPQDAQQEPAGGDPAARKARREAQALRARTKAAEAERDAAVAERDTAQATVERLIRARAEEVGSDMGLIDPRDLWRHGVNLADLYARDDNDEPAGGIDPERVKAAVDRIAADAPHLRRPGWRPAMRNDRLTFAQRIKFGVEPAPDAPAEEWDAWLANRHRHTRSGLNPGDTHGAPVTSWQDALRRA